MRTYFSSTYAPASVPTLARLAVAANELTRLNLVELCEPKPVDANLLAGRVVTTPVIRNPALDADTDFVVIDRGGPQSDGDCDEVRLDTPPVWVEP